MFSEAFYIIGKFGELSVMPFMSEEIFMKLYHQEESIMISKWSEYKEEYNFEKEENAIEQLKEIIYQDLLAKAKESLIALH